METAIGGRLGVSAQILDGKALSRQIRDELKVRVDQLKAKGIHPRLDVIVASQDPASLAYVRMKRKWAEEAGIISESFSVDATTTQSELMAKVRELNENPAVHGVLIQHPLPSHLDENEALLALGAEKDVDGITPQSLGRLTADLPGFRCATPLGMMTILDRYGIECEGKRAVVIGRSIILGKPAALMLLQKNATVTIAHSRTKDLPDLCREADILVAAVGRPEMVKGDWIKPGAAVLDAGYNKVEGLSHDVGDVEFESASQVAGWITPVPGGVGPMTVASLLANAVTAAENR
ncbi:MAG TPA: bifunctional 5,10-methylenetetrahydrofolate dehydrogenase/5,10-methenyltetrahydrofolate cyclohydrolase [Fimbriimonadaceae bacterium]|nr:bifunctional 5,10-methylenetetrahydrofolate dehydrogenase/5,10-methenyltetrahydrofolate cyclohydrolase [Fimbriimonadaceae bacterium]